MRQLRLRLSLPSALSLACCSLLALGACKNGPNQGPSETSGPGPGGIVPTGDDPASSATDKNSQTKPKESIPDIETGPNTEENPKKINPACYGVEDCYPIDLLFVIDNSGTMGEEQENLARNFAGLIDKLLDLKDADGKQVKPSINLMITTSDVGHPLCVKNKPKPYFPAMGKPIATACTDRIQDFTGRGSNPATQQSACTNNCAGDEFLPMGQPFLHFGPEGKNSNVKSDEIRKALSCMGPQGINGCGYEAPLEAMLRALDPREAWNQGERPFLRDGAYLGVAIVTDEADCSVITPSGNEFFLFEEKNEHVELDPNGQKAVSSAVCWNGGVTCDAKDKDGNYQNCRSEDKGVLHPVSRYVNRLKSYVAKEKEVIMLGILGVPEVTAHNPEPPFQPTAGGVFDLKYRDWTTKDIEEGPGSSIAEEQWKFGIGPGCTRKGTGQAVPPVRIKEVCESLNRKDDKDGDQIRCCIESICDEDFSNAMKCLSGLIRSLKPPI